ncbi:MAG: UDP-N-acetylmuramate dehydrogenase [Candidatus Kerfeldbacteria bacterium]|nr:UDP-N-acetylmuramate dehydrogenase [Candidatus Kerfeldbacteria bacterium]
MNSSFPALAAQLPGLQRNVWLAPYTTVKIGGPADYFLVARSADVIERAFRAASELYIPCTVLGGGSNVLIADSGVRGLTLRLFDETVLFSGTSVTVGAGFNLSRLAQLAAERSLSGLECAMGIPGTVGGAVRGNAGAFGWEIKDVLVRIEMLTDHCTRVVLTPAEMEFGYRTSRITETHETVLSVTLALRKADATSIRSSTQEKLAYRRERQPLDRPSFGSAFRNVPLTTIAKRVQEEYDMTAQTVRGMVPAGFLLDRLDLKGYRVGDAQVSEKHANFLVNCGSATAEQMIMLVGVLKQKVRTAFGGLELKEEFHYVGFI